MKTVLITGASSGFGLKMVEYYLNDGWKVLASCRSGIQRKELFSEFSTIFPDRLEILSLDVTKQEEISAIAEYISDNEGNKLDVLVNNAGYGAYGALEDFTAEQIRYQMEVNFFGPCFLTKALLPALRNCKGKVINITSLMGRYSCPLASVYSASKFALEGLSEGLYYELKRFGVCVVTVQPGGHRTGFVTSVHWAENSFGHQSIYQAMSDGFSAMMKKLQARKKAPGPEGVAKLVLKVSNKKPGPRRRLVGSDAKLVGVMQAFLPEPIYHWMLHLAYKKVFKK